MFFDFFFYYYYVLRLRLIYTLKTSFLLLPFLTNLLVFFPIRNLQELSHPKIFNYVYLFRFFFGRHSLINSYTSFFNLGKYYYSFNVSIFYNSFKSMALALIFFVYELQPILNLKLTTFYNFSLPRFFNWGVNDLNVFTEIKTNVGLFDLADCLYFRFYFNNIESRERGLDFVQCFKINLL